MKDEAVTMRALLHDSPCGVSGAPPPLASLPGAPSARKSDLALAPSGSELCGVDSDAPSPAWPIERD
jgi:hypothetical protein